MRRLVSFSVPCLTVVFVAALSGGCSGANDSAGKGGGNGSSSGGSSSSGGGDSGPPHAVGTILLAETHAPTGGSSTPELLASFLPDSTAIASTCATQVGGCTFVTTPACGASGCGAGEECTWDASCNPTCKAACTLPCQSGQECYFAAPSSPACRTIETFDAGALAFAGTTSPITLFPPYQYEAAAGGAPFLPGGSIEVKASGATGAGFNQFDEKFTATSLLQTTPPLDSIAATTVFGTGPIPVGWAPGSDTITVTVTGVAGTATCTATDSTGSFQIPRSVVSAAMGAGGTSQLQIGVTRERDDWDKGASTHGSLAAETVQSVGWVEVSTASSESASFQGCPGSGETMCTDGCFDTQSDPYHCGSCDVVCGADQTCDAGQCSGSTTTTSCSTCETSAESTTCSSQTTSCEDDGECTSYSTCVGACTAGDSTCKSSCETEYPLGYTDFLAYRDCICETACSTECASACAQ
ncbi:MAG TPA: hypothetical protein VGG39_33900 [Polyangiaceae bacterium]|jgi:hypothetical protein